MFPTFHIMPPGGTIRERKFAYIDREGSVLEASRLLRSSGAVELLVTDSAEGRAVPVGVVTPHDIVTRVVATGLDPAVLTAGDILTLAETANGTSDSPAAAS